MPVGEARSGIREPVQRVEVDVTFLRMDTPAEGTAPSLPADATMQIVAAFAADPHAGALQLDGKMIDAPHLKAAMRVLARE